MASLETQIPALRNPAETQKLLDKLQAEKDVLQAWATGTLSREKALADLQMREEPYTSAEFYALQAWAEATLRLTSGQKVEFMLDLESQLRAQKKLV